MANILAAIWAEYSTMDLCRTGGTGSTAMAGSQFEIRIDGTPRS